ncbi:PIN-like domain-containing protein [Caulobacter sp. BE254]|uniref:PIN-like domain-containing protein n=1 Tax=Caulobacter sp. BE254 TaxID=2817720 RepID=UPI002859EA29|nr:PIN domain-containing protein [Caulobacter sp. BE254]MDR7118644.1 hypothetical protein [Caulobacter sp. BE254]
MKTKFNWYLEPSSDEIRRVWRNGILTLDANVLLDLYRYHTQTRENLLTAIEGFGKRVWISNQSAREFIRNRKNVIASAERTFRDASKSLDELSSNIGGVIGNLRGFRLVPRSGLDILGEKILSAISESKEMVKSAQESHPNYLREDDILKRILKVFDGRVGEAFDEVDYAAAIVEAQRRMAEKIPPGYMDDDKDAERPYGDFMLWRQTLEFSKSSSSPIVYVTSEKKEDWWEVRSGKTMGPRIELMEEAFRYTGQRIIIYQTDSFLEVSSSQSGKEIDATALEEIREIGSRRIHRKLSDAAVRVRQYVQEADMLDNSGILEIELLRPVHMMTGSGAFDPHMDSVPEVNVEVISSPIGAPELQVRAATGTKYDFNVHMRSAEKGVHLPVGVYQVRYYANGWSGILESIGDVDEPTE